MVEVDTTYDTYVQEDRARGDHEEAAPADVKSEALWLEEALADFPVGALVAYLDGVYFDVGAEPGTFEGISAIHNLQHLPHFEALTEPDVLRATLGEPSYWFDRAAPEPCGVA